MEASAAFPHRSNPNPMSISTFNQHVLKPSLHRFMDFPGAFVQAWVVMILTLRRTKAPFRRAASSCWEVPAPVLSLQRWSAGIVNEPRQRAKIGGARSGCYENVRTTLNSIGPWLGVRYCHCFVFSSFPFPGWHGGTSGLIEATVPKPVKTGDMESLAPEEEIMGLNFEASKYTQPTKPFSLRKSFTIIRC